MNNRMVFPVCFPLLLLVLSLGEACPASAAVVVENFNYGTTETGLFGLGSAGEGWGDGWTGGAAGRANYINWANLTYGGAGYNNEFNPADESGVVRQVHADGNWVGMTVRRPLAEMLTGTVWISALMRPNGASSAVRNHVVLFAGGDANTTFNSVGAGIRGFGENTYLRYFDTDYNGDNFDSQNNALSRGAVTLVLMRLTVNYNEHGHDRAEIWYNPDLTGGISGLGSPKFTQEGADALGSGVTEIGVGFGRATDGSTSVVAELDAIRISNREGLYGLYDVLGREVIPEPGSLGLLLLGALLMRCVRRSTN